MPFREATSADLNKTTLDYSEIWNADDIRITLSFLTNIFSFEYVKWQSYSSFGNFLAQ